MKKPLASLLFCFSWVFLLMLVSAGSSEELTDEQKLERINELYGRYKRSFSVVPDVSVEELMSMKAKGEIVLVDRRERKEQEVSMLPDAIPSRELERNIKQYRDNTIVVYCTIGNRSGYYARELIQKGLNAYNLIRRHFGLDTPQKNSLAGEKRLDGSTFTDVDAISPPKDMKRCGREARGEEALVFGLVQGAFQRHDGHLQLSVIGFLGRYPLQPEARPH